MISSLYIKNVAVVKELNIDFNSGFSVLTGETGAGKSVIMDCIGILIGSRSVKGKIRNGEQEAIIRAAFENLPSSITDRLRELGYEVDDELILQRNFTVEGKNTVRINGQSITQGMAKEIGSNLITIHGQNDNQKLMQKGEHLGILDAYADLENIKIDYFNTYSEYIEAKKRLDNLKSKAKEKIRLFDIYQFQANEIDEINLKIGEEEYLLSEEKRLQNIEKIEKHSKFTYHALYSSERSVSALIDKASSSLAQLSAVIPKANELNEKLIQMQYEINDIADEVVSWAETDGENTDKKLDKIGARLNAISRLKKKYGNSAEEILAFRKELQISLDEMENSDELIEKTEHELKLLEKTVWEKGTVLTDHRKASAKRLQDSISAELEFLEMPKVRFLIDIRPAEQPLPTGLDNIEFLISTNLGQPPMPMIKIASGGELSRIMLAIKSILLNKDGASAVIFDEVDTGISGKTSRKVGIKLKQIAKHIQVICVTHSAQIASLSDNHYLISKSDVDGAAQTNIRILDYPSKVSEVARILGGLNITETQVIAAREMIDEGQTL